MPDLVFAPASLDDFLTLYEIERASHPRPWSERMFREELEHPLGLALVARDGETVVGFFFSRLIFEDLHITNIAVLPARRGEGVGRSLLEAGLAAARARGAVRALLEVRPSNEPALALYRAAGFREVGRRKGYYEDTGEDAVLFTLDLDWGRI